MATKKAAPSANKKTAPSAATSAGPAASAAPEHLRVDPESAATEYLKSLLPAGAPAPVFSTMALVHGKDAVGAKGIREGFSWNAQMDLLWALGFPECVLIVDGLDETKKGILKAWDPKGEMTTGEWWQYHSTFTFPRILSRRGAFALLYEVEHDDNPFFFSDAKFQQASEPYEIQPQDAVRILRKTELDFDNVAYLLEALLGPDLVAAALLEFVEGHEEAVQLAERAADALSPLLRRLPEKEAARITKTLSEQKVEKDSGLEDFIQATVDPLGWAQRQIANGEEQYGLATLVWVDGYEELAVKCLQAELKDRPDVPTSRSVFVGGAKLAALEVAHFKKYDARDVAKAYISDYTTMCETWLLPAIAELATKKEARAFLEPWARKHAGVLAPALTALSKDAKLAKQAAALLKMTQ